eukprot:snap_masked-scaffold_12-processed-gene-5.35-mRNA-1 protein AED:1.00 eAED:1.00 QI:0/-1/0/0/-1/1/1/0/101
MQSELTDKNQNPSSFIDNQNQHDYQIIIDNSYPISPLITMVFSLRISSFQLFLLCCLPSGRYCSDTIIHDIPVLQDYSSIIEEVQDKVLCRLWRSDEELTG